jgi:alkanesulfonate monooxygenase SsuD/methylene tetrahydromethanopterin reductase-like flavin-dependent oxidoreductase (luciferase family)
MVGVLVGANDAEMDRRADALLAGFGQSGPSGREWLDKRRSRWIIGTPDQARATVARFAEAGIERIMLQDFIPLDGGMIDLMGEELIGRA